LPFSVSEETSGSIACPSSASLISGHIGSYGSLSRAGAGLLCSETDHLGFILVNCPTMESSSTTLVPESTLSTETRWLKSL
jgi:Asp-tRNA(Asn)/Glu-tRNA(Gln) amidotransferase A subunit family amidase